MNNSRLYIYCEIIKYANIDGKQIAKADHEYAKNVFGIYQQNIQNYLLTEIGKYRKITYRNQQLFGWGQNSHGQLGLPKQQQISHSQKISFKLCETETISQIYCGMKASCIQTSSNRLYLSHPSAPSADKKSKPFHWLEITAQFLNQRIMQIDFYKDNVYVLLAAQVK
jgi:hypothetical protein